MQGSVDSQLRLPSSDSCHAFWNRLYSDFRRGAASGVCPAAPGAAGELGGKRGAVHGHCLACGCWIPRWPAESVLHLQSFLAGRELGKCFGGRRPGFQFQDECACHFFLILIARSRNVWIWSYLVFDVELFRNWELTFQYGVLLSLGLFSVYLSTF